MLEKYLQGYSLTKIAYEYYKGEYSPKTVNLAVIEASKYVERPIDILTKLIGQGHEFKTSPAIAIDLTNPPFNPLGKKDLYPTIFMVCDATLPRLPYNFQSYPVWPSDNELLEVIEEFALLSRRYNKTKIKQVTLDNGVQLIRILPDILDKFPGALPQISIPHTKRYIFKMLPINNVTDPEVKSLRLIIRNALDTILSYISDPDRMRGWVIRLQRVNDIGDDQIEKVLSNIMDMADLLTNYAKNGIRIKTTNQCEGIYSILEERIDAMRGFKSIESLRYVTNAFLAYRLFQKFVSSRYREYKDKRPIDLCFSPEPRGVWADYCFKEAFWY